MKKIKITQKQAMMLENLNKKTVIKITESQYKRLIENLSEVNIDDKFTNAMPSELRPAFLADRKALSKGMRESLWESFVNELYGLNESSEKVYETLINLMEACGYVENRKLSKTKFEGDKQKAKNVILGGLEKLHETGSPFMAMEAMEDIKKSLEVQLTQRSGEKPKPEDIAKKLKDLRNRELELNPRINLTPEKEPVDPNQLKLDLSEIDGEEAPTKMVPVSPEVEDEVDTITMDVPLFIRALEYSREDAKNDLDIHDIAQNAVSLSKDYGVLNMDNYSEIFGDAEEVEPQPSGEEPINELEGEDLCDGTEQVIGADIINHEPFKSLPNTRKEVEDMGKSVVSLRSLDTPGANVVIFAKQDLFDHRFEYNGKVYNYGGYIDDFKRKYGEEPIFCNIKTNADRNIVNAIVVNMPARKSLDPRGYGPLDEKEIDEVTAMGGGSPVFSGPGGFPVGKAELKSESKIQEALNALKKK